MSNPVLEQFKRSVAMWTEELAEYQTAPNMTIERLLGANGSLIYAQRDYIAALESILEVFIVPAAPVTVEPVAVVFPEYPKRCNCPDGFSPSADDSFVCEVCSGLRF